jgi:GNAT superfamily N-acetyltransferase
MHSIRPATPNDAAAVAHLAKELGSPGSVEDVDRRMTAILADGHHEVFIAEAPDGSTVGWIHVFLSLRAQTAPFAELGGMVVKETRRRQGIGRRLLEAAETWAIGCGAAKMRIRSRDTRSDAKAFYLRSGFAHSKTQRIFDKDLR